MAKNKVNSRSHDPITLCSLYSTGTEGFRDKAYDVIIKLIEASATLTNTMMLM